MNVHNVIEQVQSGLLTTLTLAVPLLAIVFVVSLVVSVLQALTQIQDPTISLVPRLLAGAAGVLLLLPWMLDRMTQYFTEVYSRIGSPF